MLLPLVSGRASLISIFSTTGWLSISLHLFTLVDNNGTWRIIPVSKWLVTPIYKPFRPFGRGITPVRGLTITMVINHLLTGVILQVVIFGFSPLPHRRFRPPCPATQTEHLERSENKDRGHHGEMFSDLAKFRPQTQVQWHWYRPRLSRCLAFFKKICGAYQFGPIHFFNKQNLQCI